VFRGSLKKVSNTVTFGIPIPLISGRQTGISIKAESTSTSAMWVRTADDVTDINTTVAGGAYVVTIAGASADQLDGSAPMMGSMVGGGVGLDVRIPL
jgi:hypothetical protein